MSSNVKKNYGYLNPSRPHPIDLTAAIKTIVKVLRGVVAYVELEDVTQYGATLPIIKSWTLLSNTSGSVIDTYTETGSYSNLTLDKFSIEISNGNVIGLTITTADGKIISLNLALDEVNNPIDPKPIGEKQTYQFIVTLTPMLIKTTDSLESLLPTLLPRLIDGLEELLVVEDLTLVFNGGKNGFMLIDPDTIPDSGDEYWYKEFSEVADFNVDVNNTYSGNVTSIKLLNGITEYINNSINLDGGVYWGNATDALAAVNLQSDFIFGNGENILSVLSVVAENESQSNSEIFKIRVDYPNDLFIETDQIGTKDSVTCTITSIGTIAGNITISVDGVNSIVAVDPSVQTTIELMRNKIVADFFITGYSILALDIDKFIIEKNEVGNFSGIPIDIIIDGDQDIIKSSIILVGGTGEMDSNQVPVFVVVDEVDGDVVNVGWEFKNFIFLKLDKTFFTLVNFVVEWSIDNFVTSNVMSGIGVNTGDYYYFRVPIPIYGEIFKLRVKNVDLDAYTRSVECEINWINETYMTPIVYKYDSSRILDLDIDMEATNEIFIDGAKITESFDINLSYFDYTSEEFTNYINNELNWEILFLNNHENFDNPIEV